MSQTNYGGTNYQVNTGENNTNIFYPEPDVPIVGIPNNLPRTHVKAFVGRSQELTQLHEQLQRSNRLAIASIAGMGGIGKTELALQYALHQLEQETYLGGLCWLRARESEVGTQIVNFARSRLGLKLPEGLDLDNQIGFCWQHWREGEVLLILDDVTDYSLIQPYLPSDPRFKILLTTRLQLGQSFQQLEIRVLDEAAALELLKFLTDADRIDGQLEAAKHLCQWLGCLPLALELVGRYLAQKLDLSLTEMQRRLEAKRLDANALRQVEDGMTAPLGVAAAFELSWQELDAAALELCYLLSLFALAPIQWQWVEQCFPDRDTEYLEDLRDRQLTRFSLLQRSGEQTYLLHQLIREFFQAKSIAVENSGQVDELRRSICRVMTTIARTIPEAPTLTEIAQLTSAIPHLEFAACQLSDFYGNENLIGAFTGVARFYQGQGQYYQAESWRHNCVEALIQRLGQEHSDVATSLDNLARLYYLQGRYSEAKPLYIRSLDIRERQLGHNHPDTATTLNNLAGLYESQGRYGEAEQFYIRSLDILERQLESENFSVATNLNNLGGLYHLQGRYSEAEPLYIRSLDIRERLLGSQHPDVASSLHNLARLYESQGSYSEAEQFYIRSLNIWEQQLGSEHPNVGTNLNNLAWLYYLQGRYSEAEPLYIRSLNLGERQLGSEHPSIAISLNNLAELYKSQGRFNEAEPLYIRSLDILERQLGQHHPNVAISLDNLAGLYKSQGRYSEAEPLYIRSLDILERQLGHNHPDTATTLNNLAGLYESQGRYGEAEPLYIHSLDIRKQQLGKEHPAIANSLYNLALLYQAQERYSEAELLFLQALAICEQRLGMDHPNTIKTRSNLQKLREAMEGIGE